MEETENAFTSLLIYPNPVSEEITLSNLLSGSSIEVYSVLGELVYRAKILKAGELEIDLSGKSNGLYFVIVTKGTKSIVRKVMKK